MKQVWSSAHIDELRILYEQGASDAEIAKALNRTEGSVSNARQFYRITRPAATLKRAPDWTEDELQTARHLYAQGWPNEIIARSVGRSRIAIKRAVQSFGFTRIPESAPPPQHFNSSTEEWRQSMLEGYAVSTSGKIMSLLPGKVGMVLRFWTDGDGYKHVTLQRRGRNVRCAVHVLVAVAFHGPRPSQNHQVAHNDGRSSNVCASNLRWATPAENHSDRLIHGTAKRRSNGQFIKCR